MQRPPDNRSPVKGNTLGTYPPPRRLAFANGQQPPRMGIKPARMDFVDAWRLAALPETEIGPALHRLSCGTLRACCRAERLAAAVRAGTILCKPAAIRWTPLPRSVESYMAHRWGACGGRAEHMLHRRLRGAAVPLLAALLPGRPLQAEAGVGGRGCRDRRPDLLACDAVTGLAIAVEVGSTNADSVYQQLMSGSATHVLVFPFSGVDGGKLVLSARGYQFHRADVPSLAVPPVTRLRRAWATLVATREAQPASPASVCSPRAGRPTSLGVCA